MGWNQQLEKVVHFVGRGSGGGILGGAGGGWPLNSCDDRNTNFKTNEKRQWATNTPKGGKKRETVQVL